MINRLLAKKDFNTKKFLKSRIESNIIKSRLKVGVLNDNFKELEKQIPSKLQQLNQLRVTKNTLLNLDLSYLFQHKPDSFFDCYFFKNNIAWISKKNGHYRYFTKLYKNKVKSYDFIDFAIIYYDLNSVSKLLNKYKTTRTNSLPPNLTSIEDYWKNIQINKYKSNIQLVQELKSLNYKYPFFYDLFNPHKQIFLFLNNQGFNNLLGRYTSYSQESVFFTSSNYIANCLGISQSKVSKVVNFLCLLGVLRKVPKDLIPKEMLKKSKKIARSKNYKNIINYYIIYDISEKIESLESQAVKIRNSNIKYSTISKSKVVREFGSKYGDLIYPEC